MAKRSRANDVSLRDVKEIPQIFTEVQAIFPAKIISTGEVTKTKYTWSGGGTIISVDDRDVPALLLKKVGTGSCCGNTSKGNLMFRVIR